MSYRLICCHTERSEVSIKKTKNRLLNAEFVDISLVSLTQYDNIIFAVSAPCKSLSPFVKARKDKMRKILCKFDFKGEIELNFTKNLTKKQKSAKNSSFFAKKMLKFKLN